MRLLTWFNILCFEKSAPFLGSQNFAKSYIWKGQTYSIAIYCILLSINHILRLRSDTLGPFLPLLFLTFLWKQLKYTRSLWKQSWWENFPRAVLMAQERIMTGGWKLSHYILIIISRVFSESSSTNGSFQKIQISFLNIRARKVFSQGYVLETSSLRSKNFI